MTQDLVVRWSSRSSEEAKGWAATLRAQGWDVFGPTLPPLPIFGPVWEVNIKLHMTNFVFAHLGLPCMVRSAHMEYEGAGMRVLRVHLFGFVRRVWPSFPDDEFPVFTDVLPDGRHVELRTDRNWVDVRVIEQPIHNTPIVEHVPGRPCGGGTHLCPLCRALLGR